jgi:hypothetical protein
MHHFPASLRAVAMISIAALVPLSTGATTTVSGAESAAPVEALLATTEAPQHRVADLSDQADSRVVSTSPTVEHAQLPSLDAACLRSESRSSAGADQRLQQIADVLELGGEQIAEIEAIQMLADDRFTPHISQSDLTESVRAVLSGAQADCLIALLLRG